MFPSLNVHVGVYQEHGIMACLGATEILVISSNVQVCTKRTVFAPSQLQECVPSLVLPASSQITSAYPPHQFPILHSSPMSLFYSAVSKCRSSLLPLLLSNLPQMHPGDLPCLAVPQLDAWTWASHCLFKHTSLKIVHLKRSPTALPVLLTYHYSLLLSNDFAIFSFHKMLITLL